ncbi:hypothetical protein EVAR_25818_1 [Eumeta japonica]|uniref:Retrotransposon gag domain-containing protein n=1 Tax=Eumeta variegata TaxID=151549 RepID=A0A4C1VUY6_EUMVA|nr:hypothetical protein EVAR_25818_1 [Eumeta japonica]
MVVGTAMYDVTVDMCTPALPETETFEDLVDIIKRHLKPRRSDIAERHIFLQRRQRPGEDLSHYLQNLKHLTATCNFGTNLEENLRDQFVSGLVSEDMRNRIFADPKLE